MRAVVRAQDEPLLHPRQITVINIHPMMAANKAGTAIMKYEGFNFYGQIGKASRAGPSATSRSQWAPPRGRGAAERVGIRNNLYTQGQSVDAFPLRFRRHI